MSDDPILIAENKAPSKEVYAMECALKVTRRETCGGTEIETRCEWSGFASLPVVDSMLGIMMEVAMP